jgi:hypothetical protein
MSKQYFFSSCVCLIVILAHPFAAAHAQATGPTIQDYEGLTRKTCEADGGVWNGRFCEYDSARRTGDNRSGSGCGDDCDQFVDFLKRADKAARCRSNPAACR